MSSRGDTREQPSIPEPAQLSIEHVSLAVAVVALTIALSAAAVESMTHLDLMMRGGYAILAALIVCGFVGYCAKLVLRELAYLKGGQMEVREATRKAQGQEDPLAPEAEAALRRISIKLLQGGREIS